MNSSKALITVCSDLNLEGGGAPGPDVKIASGIVAGSS